MIPRRSIPRAGIEVSEIGFGAAPLGNLYHPISDLQAKTTLECALQAGMRYVDTAPHYGHGLSERRTGDALRERPGIVLSTKVGRLLRADPTLRGSAERQGFRSALPFVGHYDYTYDSILRSYEDSLQRLGLARIDLLFVHDIGARTHGARNAHYFDQLTKGRGFEALQRLRDEGAIAGFGIGANEWQAGLDALARADCDVMLLAGRYTLLEQGALDQFLPRCLDRQVAVVIGGAYNSGILATGTMQGGELRYDYGEAPADIVARVARLEAHCRDFQVPLAAAALQFPLAHPAVASVILGLGAPAQVEETIQLHRLRIPSQFWLALRDAGLIAEDAPVPADRQMRIDSHFHLWRPARGDYGWLTPAAGSLYRDHEPDEFAPLLAAHGIDAAILVQAAPSAAETEFLLAHAELHPWIAGVVGWTDMAAGDAPARIAALAGTPKLLGLRPMLQDLSDPAWILDDRIRPALQAMARHGLVFDALVRAAQLPAIRVLAARHPDLSIVLDHFGKPQIGDAPGSAWMDAISALADAPNVAVKFSGLLTESPAGADATTLAPFFDHVVRRFGAGRMIWGSDWPVLTMAGTYADWLAISHALLAPFGSGARKAILGANAARIYKI